MIDVYLNGTVHTDEDNLYHKEDDPAIITIEGDTWWYFHGRRHREDGPAIENKDGTFQYWWYGKKIY